MSDQRPKPLAPNFEVPDLELEPVSLSLRQALPANARPAAPGLPASSDYSAPNLFDEESFSPGALNLSLDLDRAAPTREALFGSLVSFEDPGTFELEPSAPAQGAANVRADAARTSLTLRNEPQSGAQPAWPTGRALDSTRLKLDPVELVILADYGPIPKAIQLTPGYAYRVFRRQRELKRQLLSVAAECQRAELERAATLAELARAVRPAAEAIESFRRLLAPLVELEQVASQRGQALSSINAQLAAQSADFDANLAHITAQISSQEQLERDALRVCDERDALAKRADAKQKRVHIEIRAVSQIAEQKLGPQGGPIPEAEAAQLAALRQRARAMKPEAEHAQLELDQAKHALGQVRAQLDVLRQSERQALRNKQALAGHYQQELLTRSQGLTESEAQQRTALAELARGVLAAPGSLAIPDAWLERVRRVSERADQLIVRRETLRGAIESYDALRVAQGVRLACTLLAVVSLLIVLKLVF